MTKSDTKSKHKQRIPKLVFMHLSECGWHVIFMAKPEKP